MKVKNLSEIIEDANSEVKPLYVIMALVELVLGIFLIIYPDIGTKILTVILGAILAGVGVFNLISYLMNNNSSFRQGVLSGVISAALGIAFIAQAETIVNVTSIILGVFIIFEGLTSCKRAFIMKKLEFAQWFIFLIIAIITCVVGALILIFPEFFGTSIMIVSGALLAVEAVLGIVLIILITRFKSKLESTTNTEKETL